MSSFLLTLNLPNTAVRQIFLGCASKAALSEVCPFFSPDLTSTTKHNHNFLLYVTKKAFFCFNVPITIK